MLEKGANDFGAAIYWAEIRGHIDIVELLCKYYGLNMYSTNYISRKTYNFCCIYILMKNFPGLHDDHVNFLILDST